MNNLKRTVGAVALTLLVSLTGFAGESTTPPEPPPPGETQGPAIRTVSGQMPTPPAAGGQVSFAEIAASILESLLPLF